MALVEAIGLAVDAFEPRLFGKRHYQIDKNRKAAKNGHPRSAMRERDSEKPHNRGYVLRIAAIAIKAACL